MTGESVDESAGSDQSDIKDLSSFQLKRVINANRFMKFICVEGTFEGKVGTAMILLERTLPTYKSVKTFISDKSKYTLVKNTVEGEVDSYVCIPQDNVCSLKATLIFPATVRHIKKYEVCPFHVINETADLYFNVTLPYITVSSFNINWVYNILTHVEEEENIVYEDTDPDTGFVFMPDLKWDKKRIENLYMLAIVHARNIKSLRDLTSKHLPLLKNIRTKGLEVIKSEFGLSQYQLRIYLHYQPSYYHLHVHFTHIEFAAPGISAYKSHLLDTVINNIEMVPDYYQRATLTFTLKEADPLFLKFKEKGLVKEVTQSSDNL